MACGIEAVKLIHFYELREKFYGNVPEENHHGYSQVYPNGEWSTTDLYMKWRLALWLPTRP
jgi:hypothetical protein